MLISNQNPGGSSTGSAVGVAAGYSPISLGGEANGFIQTPASRSALFAIKCTPQTLRADGIFHVMPTVEAIGPLAKTVGDLEEVTKVILKTTRHPVEILVDRSKTWKEFKLNFVDPDLWRLPTHLFIPTDEYKTQVVRYIIFHLQRAPKLTNMIGCSLSWSTRDHQSTR
jgi:amidase